MPNDVSFTIDAAKFARDGDRLVRQYLTAGTNSVTDATIGLERDLEAATKAAAGGNLHKAWRSRSFPRRGRPARDPVGEVYTSKGPRTSGAITYWTKPGSARGKQGQFLAIPLPAAGRAKTPLEWEHAHNTDLEFVPRPGRAGLLVAQTGNINKRGRFQRLSIKQLKAGTRGRSWVPMFVLIPLIRFRNAVAVEPMVMRAQRDLVDRFLREASQVD